MIRFSALLRREGLPVTLSQTTDGVRALEVLDVGDRDELRHGLRTVFIGRPEEVPAFDRCFDTFWRQPSEAEAGLPGLVQPTREGEDDAAPSASTQKREALALETWGTEEESESDEPLGVPAVSDQEALTGRDFSTFTPDQLDEVYRITGHIARALARPLTLPRRAGGRRARLVGRDADRRISCRVQPGVVARGRSRDDRDRALRRLGHGRARPPGRRAPAHQAPRRARDLAESLARQSLVRAAHPGHGRGAAPRRRFCRCAQSCLPARSRGPLDAVTRSPTFAVRSTARRPGCGR